MEEAQLGKCLYFFSDDNTASGSLREEALVDFQMDYREDNEKKASSSGGNALRSSVPKSLGKLSHPPLIQGVGTPNRVRFQLPGEAQLAEEADRLLKGLGPRFTDWWGHEPLPVDADFLPTVVPGYRRPFRLLPYGVKPKLLIPWGSGKDPWIEASVIWGMEVGSSWEWVVAPLCNYAAADDFISMQTTTLYTS